MGRAASGCSLDTRANARRAKPCGGLPVIVARGCSEEQCRAYTIADNMLDEQSEWDEALLREELSGLLEDRLRSDDDRAAGGRAAPGSGGV